MRAPGFPSSVRTVDSSGGNSPEEGGGAARGGAARGGDRSSFPGEAGAVGAAGAFATRRRRLSSVSSAGANTAVRDATYVVNNRFKMRAR